MIRRPTMSKVGLVGQWEKASLEGAEWTREIYNGSKNELQPHTVRGGVRARAGEDRTLRSDGRLEGNGRTEARPQRRSRRARGGLLNPSSWRSSGRRYAPATLPLGADRVGQAVRGPDESSGRTGSRGENMIAPAASDFRPSQAPQLCSEPVGSFVRPMPVIIGAPGGFEGRPVRCLAGAVDPGVPFVTFVCEAGRIHLRCGKGKL